MIAMKDRRCWHVAPGEKTISSQIKDNKALLEFDWVGLGSPRTFRLKIGDKIEDINLPDDFPKVGLDHTDIIKVYDEEQKVSIKTTSTRAPDNIEIEIDLDPIQFPTYVSAGDQVLFCVSRVGNRTTVRNRDGKWLWDIVVVELK